MRPEYVVPGLVFDGLCEALIQVAPTSNQLKVSGSRPATERDSTEEDKKDSPKRHKEDKHGNQAKSLG